MPRFYYSFSERFLFACLVVIMTTTISVGLNLNQDVQCRLNILLCTQEQVQKIFDSVRHKAVGI